MHTFVKFRNIFPSAFNKYYMLVVTISNTNSFKYEKLLESKSRYKTNPC